LIIFFFNRWIQMARRIIFKTRRGGGGSGETPSASGGGNPNHSARPPLPGLLLPARTFNGSENDLRLNYNSSSADNNTTGQYGVVAPGQYGVAGQYGGAVTPGQYAGLMAGQYGGAAATAGQYHHAMPASVSGQFPRLLSGGGGGRDVILFSPDGGGRSNSPEGVQVYKTRVIYHHHAKQQEPPRDRSPV
jgi:hypothetical protein